jgi:putative transposase
LGGDENQALVGGPPFISATWQARLQRVDNGRVESVAARATRSCGELIGHVDTGSQYTSITFTDHLADEGIRPSIGSVADAYDNALMECVIGLYKTKCIRTTVFHSGPHRTLGDVEYATAGWVDWYNNRRLHSTLGMMSSVEFEQAHYAALNRWPQPV